MYSLAAYSKEELDKKRKQERSDLLEKLSTAQDSLEVALDYLTELPLEFETLSLSSLKLDRCIHFTSLPRFPRLKELRVCWNCHIVEFPPELGELTNLEFLEVQMCRALITLPHTIGNLRSLTKLHVRACGSITHFPPELGHLENLQTLDFYGLDRLQALPDTIAKLKHLQEWNLRKCWNLVHLPDLQKFSVSVLPSLEHLEIDNMRRLVSIPDYIGQMHSLRELTLVQLPLVTYIPTGVGNLTHLTKLMVTHCLSLQGLPESISNLPKLTQLNVDLRRNSPQYLMPGYFSHLPESLTILKVTIPPTLWTWDQLDSFQFPHRLRTFHLSGMPDRCRSLTPNRRVVSNDPATEVERLRGFLERNPFLTKIGGHCDLDHRLVLNHFRPLLPHGDVSVASSELPIVLHMVNQYKRLHAHPGSHATVIFTLLRGQPWWEDSARAT